jgi:hypothetical protein
LHVTGSQANHAIYLPQPVYDSRQFTMAEIAASCAVTPMTIYRNIRTDGARTPAPEPSSHG